MGVSRRFAAIVGSIRVYLAGHVLIRGRRVNQSYIKTVWASDYLTHEHKQLLLDGTYGKHDPMALSALGLPQSMAVCLHFW